MNKNISFFNILKVIKLNLKELFIFGFFSSALSLAIALYLPNEYRSYAVLSPKEKSSEIDTQGLGNLANLGGVSSIIGGGSNQHFDESLEILQSNKFLGQFLQNKFVELLAPKKFDANLNKIIIDPKKYNTYKDKWVRKPSSPWGIIPEEQEAIKYFRENNFDLSINRRNNFVTIGIKHISPEVSHKWLVELISQLDEKIRTRDVNEANEALTYLNERLSKTTTSNDVKNSLSKLAVKYEKTILFANINKEFAFNIIDPPFVPILKDSPKRAVIVLAIVFGMMSVFFTYLIFLFNSKRKLSIKLLRLNISLLIIEE